MSYGTKLVYRDGMMYVEPLTVDDCCVNVSNTYCLDHTHEINVSICRYTAGKTETHVAPADQRGNKEK